MSKYRQQVAQLVTVNSQPSQPSTQEQAKVREGTFSSQPTLLSKVLLPKHSYYLNDIRNCNMYCLHISRISFCGGQLTAHIERVSEMVAVMRKAASLGDDETNQQKRLIAALATENKVSFWDFLSA